LPDLVAGEQISFKFTASADCSLVPVINAGKLFANTITASFDGGSEKIITQPYLVETPLLIIKSINPETSTGVKGQIITRELKIQNTRLERVAEFVFTDLHDGGISISTQSTDYVELPEKYEAKFTGSNFRNIGNGDEYFDFDEVLIVQEKITIEVCGLPDL